MSNRKFLGVCIVQTLIGIVMLIPFSSVANSKPDVYFECKELYGTPTTVATSPEWGNQSRQFIRWTRSFGEKYTPLTRCQEVSDRFNEQFGQGAKYITYGSKNRNPVICTTDEQSKGCQALLFTLHWQEVKDGVVDPKAILEDMFSLSDRNFAGRPIRQAPCRTYVDIKAVLDNKTLRAKEICNAN